MEWITGADSNEVDIGELFDDVVVCVMVTSSWTLLDDVMVTSDIGELFNLCVLINKLGSVR